jgi:hypothetical protein
MSQRTVRPSEGQQQGGHDDGRAGIRTVMRATLETYQGTGVSWLAYECVSNEWDRTCTADKDVEERDE